MRQLLNEYPQLLIPNDVPYVGSVTDGAGWVVAASGMEAHFDEAFATAILAISKALVFGATPVALPADTNFFRMPI